MKTTKIYFSLGSNIGDKEKHICDAQSLIHSRIGEIVTESSLYITEAWGFNSDEMFLNKVVAVESELDAFAVLDTVQEIEILLGRTTKTANQYQSRIIDIDILFYDNKIIETQQLIIPHQHIQNRLFVLLPLAEIAPDFIHPKLQKTISDLLEHCTDNKNVSLYEKCY